MFSKPLPDFSCRLNALATALTCQWLMGPCKVNDVEVGGCTTPPAARVVVHVPIGCLAAPLPSPPDQVTVVAWVERYQTRWTQSVNPLTLCRPARLYTSIKARALLCVTAGATAGNPVQCCSSPAPTQTALHHQHRYPVLPCGPQTVAPSARATACWWSGAGTWSRRGAPPCVLTAARYPRRWAWAGLGCVRRTQGRQERMQAGVQGHAPSHRRCFTLVIMFPGLRHAC